MDVSFWEKSSEFRCKKNASIYASQPTNFSKTYLRLLRYMCRQANLNINTGFLVFLFFCLLAILEASLDYYKKKRPMEKEHSVAGNLREIAGSLLMLTGGVCVIGTSAYLALGMSLTTLIGGKTAYLAYGRMAVDLWLGGSVVAVGGRAIRGS